MYFSPKTSADGLVFHYDTGNTVRSYLGEPTTNLNPYTLSDSGTDGSGQGSVGTRTILSSNHVRIVDVDSNTRQTHLIQGLTGGTTYTISVEFKKLSGTPTFRFQIQDHSGGSFLRTIKFTNTSEIGIEDKEGWQRAFWTFTLGGDANAVRIWYQDGADYTTYTHAFELRNPQLEAKSHPTPFTPPSTTRSATQGLKDLTGRSTIDLTNVSFDSNAQMAFDGTNDTVSVPSNSSNNIAGDITMELVLNRTAGYNAAVMHKEVQYTLYVYSSGAITYADSSLWSYSTFGAYGNLTAGTYHHLVATKTGGVVNIYLDGTVIINKSFGSGITQTNNTLYIGSYDGSSNFFAGQIPVSKVYNRALTADEVARNFNAIKSRFNIG